MRHNYFLNAKRTLIALLVCVLLFAACTSPNAPATDPGGTKAPEPTEAPEPTPVLTEEPEPTPVPEPTAEPLDVPYYSYEQLLSPDAASCLNAFVIDGHLGEVAPSNSATLQEFEFVFADAAKRVRDEHSFYEMLDTDDECRIFVFFDDHCDYKYRSGYPVIVRQPVPYDAFAGLAIGDTIEKVVSFDPAAALSTRALIEKMNPAEYPALLEFMTGQGLTFSTLHYLTDGVLRIDYLPNDAGELVISAMTYGADWKLANAGGTVIDYRILPEDLDF